MNPQKDASLLPQDVNSENTNPASAPADAGLPSLSQEAASTEMPAGPVAGQMIEPQTPAMGVGATPGGPSTAAPVGTPEPNTPEPNMPQDSPAAPMFAAGERKAGLPATPAKGRKKGLFVALIAAAVVLLLSGGAAAYFGYYVPNQPDNVLKAALANSVDPAKAKTVQFSGELAVGEPGSKENFKGTFEGGFDGQSGATTLSTKWDAVVTSLTFDVLSADGKTFYVKLGGLSGLPSLLQTFASGVSELEPYESAISSLNDQWLQINESLVRSAMDSDNASPALSDNDRTAIAKAYLDHPFVSIKEALPDAKVNGTDSYHYRLAFNAYQFGAFNDALKDSNSSLFNASESTIRDLQEQLRKFDNNKLGLEVWISKKDKMFSQFVVSYQQVSTKLTIKSYNQKVEVSAPEHAKSILEVMGGILGGDAFQSGLSLPALEQQAQTGISL